MSQATPDTWKSVASDSYGAAIVLKRDRHWRSAISRAYFAAFSMVSGCLMELGIAMPAGREGPSHGGLPDLVVNNLTIVRVQDRPRLVSRLRELYRLRVLADYRPSFGMSEIEALSALDLMGDVFHWLEEKAHGKSRK